MQSPPLSADCPTTGLVEEFIESVLPHEIQDVPESSDVLLEELQAAIGQLSSSVAEGPDGISPHFLKHAPESLLVLLAKAFSFSLSSGCIPKIWRAAFVTPVYKSGPRHAASNWRPISVTSVVARVFEKVLAARISPMILEHISPQQSAFQSKRRMNEHMATLLHAAAECLARNSYRYCAFIDVAKAYDKVWRSGLLYKLWKVGIRGKLLRWLSIFLTQRSCRVRWGSTASDWFDSLAGIPQGSVLGCLFFILFVNDLFSMNLGNCLLLMAADDITLVPRSLADMGVVELHNALKSVSKWMQLWRLPLNLDKCCVMVFHRPRLNPAAFDFYLDGVKLKRVEHARYLGVIIDQHLSFKDQADTAVRKMKQMVGMTMKQLTCHLTSRVVPLNVCRRILLDIIKPSVLFGAEFWLYLHPHIASQLDSLSAQLLNLALRLPNPLPVHGILREAAVVPVSVDAESRLLSFYSAILSSDIVTPAVSIALLESATDGVVYGSSRLRYLGRQALLTAQEWAVPLPVSSDELRHAKCNRSANLWMARGHYAILRSLTECTVSAPADYIALDGLDAGTRAAFRLSTVSTQERHHRFDSSVPLHCPHCPASVHGVYHVVMACRMFSTPRSHVISALRRLGVRGSFSHLLGDLRSVPRRLWRRALALSLPFLQLVYQSLNVP
jgi:hypothetical protein